MISEQIFQEAVKLYRDCLGSNNRKGADALYWYIP
jgi:hypothetical protein